MIGKLKIVVLWLTFFISQIFAGEVLLESGVNKSTLTTDQTIQYYVSLKGIDVDVSNIDSIQMPDFGSKFSLRGQSSDFRYQFTNGRSQTIKTFRFSLQPLQAGEIVIGPATLDFQGKNIQSQSIAIKVTKGAATQATVSQPVRSDSGGLRPPDHVFLNNKVFVYGFIDKNNVLMGEKIIYDLYLYTSLDMNGFEVLSPYFENFLSEENAFNDQTYAIEDVKNRRFYKIHIFSQALYPLAEGEQVITPQNVRILYKYITAREGVLKSNGIPLVVQPLPKQDKPKSFSGFVGDYTLYSDFDPADSYNINVPITYKVVLSGKGPLKQINELVFPAMDGLKIYKSKVEVIQNESGQDQVVFEYIVIPKVGGPLTIPVFSFSYYSLKDQRYKTIQTNSETITVTGSASGIDKSAKKDISVINTDIDYLKEITGNLGQKAYLFDRNWVKALLGIYLLLLLWIASRFFRKTDVYNNLFSKLQPKAYEHALSRLKALNPNQLDNKSASVMQTILLEFLSQKVGQSVLGLEKVQLKLVLESNQIANIDECLKLIEDFSFSVYSAAQQDLVHRRDLYNRLIQLLEVLK